MEQKLGDQKINKNQAGFLKWTSLFLFFLFILFLWTLPLFLSKGWTNIFAEILIMSLGAAGLNLLMGGCGIISFGHAGFFGVGAYTFGLLLYYHCVPFWAAFLLAVASVTLFAIIFGWFAIRLIEIYFALFCLAFAQVIWVFVSTSYRFTGGDDGLTGIPMPSLLSSITSTYYFILIIVTICILLLYLIRESPFGDALHALRENRIRAEFIGIKTKVYIYIAFIISAIFTGIAGILLVTVIHCAFPGYASFVKSGDFLFACLLGGMYNFAGPIAGAFIYILLDYTVSRFTEYWPLTLGIAIVLIAIFLRGGIVGFVLERYRRLNSAR